MKRHAVLITILVVMVVVTAFSVKTWLSRNPPAITSPVLGPSLMSFEYTGNEVFPKFGVSDIFEAKKNIEAAVALGQAAVPRLKELCASGSPDEKVDALQALYAISPTSAIQCASPLLKDRTPDVVVAALAAIGKGRSLPAVKYVEALLASDDPRIRAQAALCLACIAPDFGALSKLAALLSDKVAVVREAAGRAIEAVTYTSFGFRHSGYDDERAASLAAFKNWMDANGGKTRSQWLRARVEACITALAGDDPWQMYEADQFLRQLLGETGFDWSMPISERVAVATKLRDKWREYEPLLVVNLPTNLEMDWE